MKKIIFFLFLIILFSGCAAAINYGLHNVPVYSSSDYNLVIDIFNDLRPQEEHLGTLNLPGILSYTKDKKFKADIEAQISKMLAVHLRETKLFKKIEVQDIPDDLNQNITEMNILKNKGIDIAITGDIKHFYGFQSGTCRTPKILFGALSLLYKSLLLNFKTVGSEIEYGGVKIIDLNQKKILWQGDIRFAVKERDIFYEGTVSYALRGLKAANNKFSQKLKDIFEIPNSN